MKPKNKIIYIAVFIGLLTSGITAQLKLAQTGFNFLEVTSDARASGMAEAVTAVPGYKDALFHNPAAMAEIKTLVNATFSINKYIADINHTSAGIILAPSEGDYGVVGVSFQSIDYGEVQATRASSATQKGYVDLGTIKPIAMSMGFGYAKMLNDKFSVGGQVKYAYQSLGSSLIPVMRLDSVGVKVFDHFETKKNETDAIAFDFGTLYKTGFKSITFGMSIRNYSKEVKFAEEGFQLPLLFTIGLSANLFDFFEVPGPAQGLLLSIDATHPRSRREQLKVGLEYQFMDVLALRGGYTAGNDLDDFTFGVGVSKYGFGIDYSYTPTLYLGNVQRFSASYSL